MVHQATTDTPSLSDNRPLFTSRLKLPTSYEITEREGTAKIHADCKRKSMPGMVTYLATPPKADGGDDDDPAGYRSHISAPIYISEGLLDL